MHTLELSPEELTLVLKALAAHSRNLESSYEGNYEWEQLYRERGNAEEADKRLIICEAIDLEEQETDELTRRLMELV